MKLTKIKKIVASAMVLSTLLSNSIVSAATTSTSTATSVSTSNSSTSGENVLKVSVNSDGSVTYTEPVSAAATDTTSTDPQDKAFSWSDATVYFVLTDRFKNADTSNDHSYGRGLQKDGVTPQVGLEGSKNIENPGTFHGGDLKGLTQKLNDGYFTKLGVNAIWITSPLEQQHGFTSGNKKGDQGQYGDGGGFPYYAYHGYWTFDPTNIDANMGTKQDFAAFVDTAHKLGIRVVMDVVLNHTGYVTMYDVNEYNAGSLKTGWQDYYFGDVTKLSGGLPENQTWYNFDSPLWANWFGADYVRMSSPLQGYTYVPNGCSETNPLCGLPDVKTESTKEIAIPPILVTKWTKEGRLAQEKASLDAFFTKQNLPRTARNYEIKWLTDWVRNYGVDGFRCDTAKHVEMAAWKSLKEQANIALKEWRTNNPTKAGAKWTDNFWMTGECWGYGTIRSAYYDNGFDSMINFNFPKDGNTANLEGTYSSYASQFNSPTSDYNGLSYISSHDTSLGARGNLIGGGTSLLLAPGAVQIFYGDETARKTKWTDWFTNDYTDQCNRSDMNWDSIDTSVLTHWQILGQFRNNHIAVGAGVHKQLSASPYTFSRVYAKNGVTDKVVCALNVVGKTDITVEGVFSDNGKVRDFYTGTMYTVSNGKVSVTPGTNGVVLLEKGDNSPDIAVSQTSTKYYTDSLNVTLYVSKGATATYSINGGAAKTYTDGQTVTIGADAAIGDKTTLTLTATNSDGTAGPSTFTYTKGDPKETLKVHAKYTQFTTTPNIYLYTGDGATATKYAGAWPGKAMTSEGNGWYVYNCTDTRTAKVIFNGSFGQTPGSQQPGVDAAGEVWILNGTVTTYNPENPTKTGTVNVKYVDENGNPVATATTKTGDVGAAYTTSAATVSGYTLKTTPANASGTFTEADITVTYVYTKNAVKTGTVNVKYVNESGTSIATATQKTGTVGTAYTTTAATVSGYTLKAVPSNASGNFIDGTITVNYVYTKIVAPAITKTATSVVSPQVVGTSIKLTTTGTGTGTLNYRFIVTKDSKIVFSKSYGTTNYTTWTPTEAGTYRIYYKLKDSSGQEVQKIISYVINTNSVAINSITPSVATQVAGKSVTISVNATNAVSYAYWINDVNGDWKLLSGYSSSSKTATWTPTVAGSYMIWVNAKDSNGKVVSKYISYTVTAK